MLKPCILLTFHPFSRFRKAWMKIKQRWGRNIYYQQVRNSRQGKRKEGVMLSHCTKRQQVPRKGVWMRLNLLSVVQCIARSPQQGFGPRSKEEVHPNITGQRNGNGWFSYESVCVCVKSFLSLYLNVTSVSTVIAPPPGGYQLLHHVNRCQWHLRILNLVLYILKVQLKRKERGSVPKRLWNIYLHHFCRSFIKCSLLII